MVRRPTGCFCLLLLLLLVAILSTAEASIACYYCGQSQLCQLPYASAQQNQSTQITCPSACMKFDGYSSDGGTRVIVRTCATPDLTVNVCTSDYTLNGATGTACQCNGNLCNDGATVTQGHRMNAVTTTAAGFAAAILVKVLLL